jgi:hypothetical protein
MSFVTAFDASGHESDRLIMVVAGFVSSGDEWAKFTTKWKERLGRDALEYFRLSEFIRWAADEAKKRALVRDLIGIIEPHAFRKFGVVLEVRGMADHFSDADRAEWNLNAYSLASLFCVKYVERWAARERIKVPIEYVFEEGDIGRDQLEKRLRRRGCKVQFKPGKRDRKTGAGSSVPAFVPLQAADFIAGEYFMEAERRVKNIPKRSSPRWPYLQFDRMQGTVRKAMYENLEKLRNLFEIAKTSDAYLRGS